MATETKQFSLRAVLTVTTGRLLTQREGPRDNGIGQLYEILNWITGDDLFTHQLPRAGETCKPYLLSLFPELAKATDALPLLDQSLALHGEDAVDHWLTQIKTLSPELRDSWDIAPMPEGWTTIDPMIELESMVGKEKIITVSA